MWMGCVGGLHPTEVPLGPVKYRGRNPPCAHSSSEEGIELCYSETYTNRLPETSTKCFPFLLLGVWGRGACSHAGFSSWPSHQWMPPFPPLCPSLICSTWIKASRLMSTAEGRQPGWPARRPSVL